MVKTITALAVAALATASTVDAVAFHCHGINYNIRSGPDWADAATKCKPATQIATELATLKKYTDRIRLYSLTDCDQATAVVPAAIAAGLKLELGLWVDSYPENYAAEKAAFETLLSTGVVTADNIVGIHVGSEAIYRGDIDYDTAVQYIGEIRELCQANEGAANIPLTVTDVGNTYRQYPDLVDAVDFVSANLFPFWDNVKIDEAAPYFLGTYRRLVDIAAGYDGNKTVVIGETGWPYDGYDSRGGVTSAANSAQYFRDFYLQAQEYGIEYYYFSSFDEDWKLAQDGNTSVEPYFGLFTGSGELHAEIAALTLDDEAESETASGSGEIEVDAGSATESIAVADVIENSGSSSNSTVTADVEVEVTVDEEDADDDDEDDDEDEDEVSEVDSVNTDATTEGESTAESTSTATATATSTATSTTTSTTTATAGKSKDCPM